MTSTHKISIIETPLSDGSPVYAVSIFATDQDGRGVTFDAIDYNHAVAMANAIKLAADADTVDQAEIVDRTNEEAETDDDCLCSDCGVNPSDVGSHLCVGCEAYRDHCQ